MYFHKSKLSKTTEVVDFSIEKKVFEYKGVDFQIYPDTKNPNTPPYAIKRNDTTPPRRISGLFVDGRKLKGDVRVGNQKRYFSIEIIPEQKQVVLEGFSEAIELLGIYTPIEQNNLFRGLVGTSERGLYMAGATGADYSLSATSEPIN